MLVYLLTFTSGKKYVGQTIRTMAARMGGHKARQKVNKSAALYVEWAEYGAPKVDILEKCSTLDSLHECEKKWIKIENTIWPSGLNFAEGGLSSASKHAETAKRIGLAARGRKASDATKEKVAEASRIHWQNPEYRSKVAKGVAESFTDERKANLSEATKKSWDEKTKSGWKMSQETKDKISRRVITDEQRQKMSESAKKRVRAPRSQETKDKIAAKTKAFWANASSEDLAKRSAQISDGFKKFKPEPNKERS